MIIKLNFVKLVKKEFVLPEEMMDSIEEKNMGINLDIFFILFSFNLLAAETNLNPFI
jgi:hypothetical protein